MYSTTWCTLQGRKHFTIDSGLPTFCNHGCNGSYNYGEVEDGGDGVKFTELNIDLKKAPPGDLLNSASKIYSPVFERHLRQITAIGMLLSAIFRVLLCIMCLYAPSHLCIKQ